MKLSILSLLLCMFLVDVAISLDKPADCKCRIQSTKRVIGGRKTDQNAFPWQVSLQMKEQNPVPDDLRENVLEKEKIAFHFCGGTIIDNLWVLTAANCIADLKSSDDFHVGYGSNDLGIVYDRKQYAEIEEFFVHPEYRNLTNNIALIKLKHPLNFTEAVQPACLPSHLYQLNYEGVLKITGFGLEEHPVEDANGNRRTGVFSRYLRENEAFDHTNDAKMGCSKWKEICVENRDKRKSSLCFGDSGGPLHYTKWGRTAVVGVASFGETNLDKEKKERTFCVGRDSFARISTYIKWIKNYLGDLCV